MDPCPLKILDARLHYRFIMSCTKSVFSTHYVVIWINKTLYLHTEKNFIPHFVHKIVVDWSISYLLRALDWKRPSKIGKHLTALMKVFVHVKNQDYPSSVFWDMSHLRLLQFYWLSGHAWAYTQWKVTSTCRKI